MRLPWARSVTMEKLTNFPDTGVSNLQPDLFVFLRSDARPLAPLNSMKGGIPLGFQKCTVVHSLPKSIKSNGYGISLKTNSP